MATGPPSTPAIHVYATHARWQSKDFPTDYQVKAFTSIIIVIYVIYAGFVIFNFTKHPVWKDWVYFWILAEEQMCPFNLKNVLRSFFVEI